MEGKGKGGYFKGRKEGSRRKRRGKGRKEYERNGKEIKGDER